MASGAELKAAEKKQPHAVDTLMTKVAAKTVTPNAYHVARSCAKKYVMSTNNTDSRQSPGSCGIQKFKRQLSIKLLKLFKLYSTSTLLKKICEENETVMENEMRIQTNRVEISDD